jgi:hypothetical protein
MHAEVNEVMDDKTLLKAYREEIGELKTKLKALESKVQYSDTPATLSSIQSLGVVESEVQKPVFSNCTLDFLNIESQLPAPTIVKGGMRTS